jgi:hypothetical protein
MNPVSMPTNLPIDIMLYRMAPPAMTQKITFVFIPYTPFIWLISKYNSDISLL